MWKEYLSQQSSSSLYKYDTQTLDFLNSTHSRRTVNYYYQTPPVSSSTSPLPSIISQHDENQDVAMDVDGHHDVDHPLDVDMVNAVNEDKENKNQLNKKSILGKRAFFNAFDGSNHSKKNEAHQIQVPLFKKQRL